MEIPAANREVKPWIIHMEYSNPVWKFVDWLINLVNYIETKINFEPKNSSKNNFG